MASRRTTVVLTPEEERALRAASKREGVSQSELIRRGIRRVTSAYRSKSSALTGWLKLSPSERERILGDDFGDADE
ncbi:MAG: ribbon-helix-helix domain-containing protein [Myxococcaceae bacterium]